MLEFRHSALVGNGFQQLRTPMNTIVVKTIQNKVV